MQHPPALLGITGLTVMGIGAIANPAVVTAQFGILELTPAGRNEVRAVGCPLSDVALLPLGQSPAGLRCAWAWCRDTPCRLATHARASRNRCPRPWDIRPALYPLPNSD